MKAGRLITLACPGGCGRAMRVERSAHDYPEAMRVEILCDECGDGSFGIPRYYDRRGEEITRAMEDDEYPAPKCARCSDTGWIAGDPVAGISGEPCGCDEDWSEAATVDAAQEGGR